MIGRLFRRGRHAADIPATLYGAVVAQARRPALYSDIGIADTVDGRFEAVVLHTVLLLRRLAAGDEEMRAVGQDVFDLFCLEMDHSLREMGVGDLAVPKRMRKIGEVYYGRAAAYDSALSSGNAPDLRESLQRSMPRGDGGEVAVAALAAYMKATDTALSALSKADLLGGEFPFADPAHFLHAEESDDDQAAARRDD
jgi:cytochrome b pre-mRNA-processing protein 3